MHWLSRDIVLRVCILCPTVEDQSLFHLILIREGDLDMKLLLVEHFDLDDKVRLQ